MSNKLMSVLSATNHWHKQFQNYYLNRKKKVALFRLSECEQKQDHNRYQQVVFDSLPCPTVYTKNKRAKTVLLYLHYPTRHTAHT